MLGNGIAAVVAGGFVDRLCANVGLAVFLAVPHWRKKLFHGKKKEVAKNA